jgi:hypothetical protein
VSAAILGAIQPMFEDISPPPGCSTTVGLPVPVQWRCMECPPTSIDRPGIEGAASVAALTVSYPPPTAARASIPNTG